jgi:hypothetical protein
VKQHRVGTEWYAATPAPLQPRATVDGTVLEVAASFVVDPTSFAFGRPLDDGPWSIYLHTRAFGYQSRVRMSGGAEGAAVLDGLPVVVTPNDQGQALLSVGATARFLRAAVGTAEVSGRASRARIEVELPGLFVRGALHRFGLRIGNDDVDAEVRGEPARLLAATELSPGVHEVRVALGDRASRPLLTVHAARPWQHVRTEPSLLGRVARRWGMRRSRTE